MKQHHGPVVEWKCGLCGSPMMGLTDLEKHSHACHGGVFQPILKLHQGDQKR